MTGRIALSLVLHNHQPVGNFGWVIADVHDRAYEPMLAALERHSGVRVGLHYSGPLLEWLVAERPAFVARIGALVERGQVEILGGGLDEPILPAIPERDRDGQLSRMAELVTATFGTRPSGAWLAERVWEPELPVAFAAAGYRWTILDDAHFRAAAVPDDELWGPSITEDQGHPLVVFGTEQGLRYRIPFRPVDEVIQYLRDHATEAGDRVGMMGDDGEKFGAWPSTWDHCWGRGRWVEDFFEALEANAGWLRTVRPSDWLAEHPPIGRVYLPTGSYAEMGQWALPPDEAVAYGEAVRRAQAAPRDEAGAEGEAPADRDARWKGDSRWNGDSGWNGGSRWLRGGFWRSFLVRYREINDLHKQMLRASEAVAAMPPSPERERATEHLHRGQSNDCYWHGLFGGIYIGHMRAATFSELIAAEDLADASGRSMTSAALLDLDIDGRDEARLSNDGQVVTVELDAGSGITSWDIRAVRHALLAVLRRRPEAYHRSILESGAPSSGAGEEHGGRGEAVSIHDGIRAKDPGLAAFIRYDRYERRSGLLRALPTDRGPDGWAAGGDEDLGDPEAPTSVVDLSASRLVTRGETSIAGQAVLVTREIELGGGRLAPRLTVRVSVEHRGDAPIAARLGQEWATMLLGGGGNPAAWWEVAEQRTTHDGTGLAEKVGRLAQGNDWLSLRVAATITPAVDAWWAPIESVSSSEGGVERTYQGSALLLSTLVDLQPGERWTLAVDQRVSAARSTSEGLSAAR